MSNIDKLKQIIDTMNKNPYEGMTPEERKLSKLKTMLEMVQNDTITPKQIEEFLKVALGVITKSKEEFANLSAENIKVVKDSIAYIESLNQKAINELDAKTNSMVGQFDAKLALLEGLTTKVESIKATPGQDGINPDPSEVVPLVLAKLPKAELFILERLEIIKEINSGTKNDLKIEAKQIEGLDKFSTKANLDRAIGILDQRTQFLINKQNTGSGSGTVGPGTTNEIAYFNSATTVASLTTATYPSLTELSYVKGVTSAIQTQLNSKLSAITIGGSVSGGGANRVLYEDSSQNLAASSSFIYDGTSVTIKGAGTTTGKNLILQNSAALERFSVLDNGQVNMSLSPTAMITWSFANGVGVGTTDKAGFDWLWSGSAGSRLRADNASSPVLGDLVYYDTTSGSEVERFRVGRSSGNITVGGTFITQNAQFSLTTGAAASKLYFQRYPGGTKGDVGSFFTFSGTGNDQYARLTFTSTTNSGRTAGDPGIADIRFDNSDLIVRDGIAGIGVTSPTATLHLRAGTATTNTAPLKFNTGTLLTAAEAGAMEFLTDGLFFTRTTGAIRENIPLVQTGRFTAETAANASIVTYTPTVDSSYWISGNVNVTTSSAEAFNLQVAYTDETNTARTLNIPLAVLGGTTVSAVNFSNGAVPYSGMPVHIRVKASTAITVKTAGTFTGATFNVEGSITKIN